MHQEFISFLILFCVSFGYFMLLGKEKRKKTGHEKKNRHNSFMGHNTDSSGSGYIL